MGIFSVTISKNNNYMESMQRLAQSYTQDSQTKSDESTIMQVRDNQCLIIDNRNVRIIVASFHTYYQNTTVSCQDDSDQDKQRC